MRKFTNGAVLQELPAHRHHPSGENHIVRDCTIMIHGHKWDQMDVYVRYRPEVDVLHACGNYDGKHVWGTVQFSGNTSATFHPNQGCNHIFGYDGDIHGKA